MRQSPKHYRSIEEFEREEIRPSQKYGFTVADLIEEASYQAEQDFSFEDKERQELDFD